MHTTEFKYSKIQCMNIYVSLFIDVPCSGVLLLNIEALRKSEEYNTLLTESVLTTFCNKYNFRGHLRDQDLFTLISTENEHLFYTLPEQWNTQLCVWWRDHGYCDVFDLYRRPLNKNSKYFYFMLTATLPFLSMNSKP